jgi:hypothetical protein
MKNINYSLSRGVGNQLKERKNQIIPDLSSKYTNLIGYFISFVGCISTQNGFSLIFSLTHI